MAGEGHRAVYAALAGNLCVAVSKFVVAGLSGSSAMLAEGIHSLVDCGDELLLLFGMRRSRRPATLKHPFGHGHVLYFWSLMVAVMIFGLGGGLSIRGGIQHILRPEPSTHAGWNYLVLGVSAVFEGSSLAVGYRQFRRVVGRQPFWTAVRSSKDPTIFTVVLEDMAALVGLAIAFAGILLDSRFHVGYGNGAASLAIGVLLCGVAFLLARESGGLLVGEGVGPETLRGIQAIAAADPGIQATNPPLTMYLGPHSILLAIEIQFQPGMTATEVAATIDRFEKAVQARYPDIRQIFVEAESIARRR